MTVLTVRGLSKTYGDARVLDAVDLEVGPGEVHALLGENGAGKSTLIKIVSGVVTPDEGTVVVDGRELHFGSPQEAMEVGVATLFQELSAVGGLTVAENVLLGRPIPSRLGVVSWGALNDRARELFSMLGQDIDVTEDADTLSPVGKTMTALARALSQESKLLILDEPTAALTDSETSQLFAAIERLQAQGIGVLYVSHRLEEVFGIAGRFTVLRNGQKVDEGQLADTSVEGVIAAMAGPAAPGTGICHAARRARARRNGSRSRGGSSCQRGRGQLILWGGSLHVIHYTNRPQCGLWLRRDVRGSGGHDACHAWLVTGSGSPRSRHTRSVSSRSTEGHRI